MVNSDFLYVFFLSLNIDCSIAFLNLKVFHFKMKDEKYLILDN